MTTTDKSEKTEIANSDNASVRKSLALAAAYGIGPFRKRVRLDAPLPYEPEESYTSFTIDVRPPEPVWNYGGKLADKPVTLVKTYYPSLSDEWVQAKNTSRNIGILSFLEDKTPVGEYRTTDDKKRYDHGFRFNRNGMCYQVEFFQPYSYHTPSCEFTISSSDDEFMRFIDQRPMTKQEAEYAIGIVKSELDAFDRVRLKLHIDRLEANLPTETEPQKTTLEALRDLKFTDKTDIIDFKKGFGATSMFHVKDLSQLGQTVSVYTARHLNP